MWSLGHHWAILAVQTWNAWSTGQSTSKLRRIGSITGRGACPVVLAATNPKTRGRLTPDALDVRLDRLHALVVELVDPARPHRLLDDETRLLEQAQMPRHGGPADRQDVRDLLDGSFARAQQLDDRSPVRVAERVERVPGGSGTLMRSGRCSTRCLSPFANW